MTIFICVLCFVGGYMVASRIENNIRRILLGASEDEVLKLRQELQSAAEVSEERQAAEYERGLRDGWDMGLKEGVQAARVVTTNKRILTELAARRFLVGGLRANE